MPESLRIAKNRISAPSPSDFGLQNSYMIAIRLAESHADSGGLSRITEHRPWGKEHLVAQAFHVEMIKPSHYDDDGYVIQWWKASIPSNSLASLYAIVQDAADRRVLGDEVALTFDGWDECNTIISEDPCRPEDCERRGRRSSSW